ncbi:hypothetical protein H0H81_011135 [Sphagnurus paluster]|uniref:Uncharacterized protein n=1 Tax=Sphagnurus paluster TaxID=117069 RepID=A0A9P7GLL1_9AGAR|nr:hypothetical protein H0H81_011135 [Sphagnurus paluster]
MLNIKKDDRCKAWAVDLPDVDKKLAESITSHIAGKFKDGGARALGPQDVFVGPRTMRASCLLLLHEANTAQCCCCDLSMDKGEAKEGESPTKPSSSTIKIMFDEIPAARYSRLMTKEFFVVGAHLVASNDSYHVELKRNRSNDDTSGNLV